MIEMNARIIGSAETVSYDAQLLAGEIEAKAIRLRKELEIRIDDGERSKRMTATEILERRAVK